MRCAGCAVCRLAIGRGSSFLIPTFLDVLTYVPPVAESASVGADLGVFALVLLGCDFLGQWHGVESVFAVALRTAQVFWGWCFGHTHLSSKT